MRLPTHILPRWLGVSIIVLLASGLPAAGEEPKILNQVGKYTPLTEPPCSYCSTQNLKGLVRPDEPVIAWLRGTHNGGAAPLRHFLAAYRVLNDTYGLFFFDPEGGYVAVYEKDYGYKFHGWREGVMVVEGRDGTLWSALRGEALSGPQKGKRLKRVPSVMTSWGHWLMLHPESTAYDLFDGERYQVAELPRGANEEVVALRGPVDARLAGDAWVLGVDADPAAPRAVALATAAPRWCVNDNYRERPYTVFWYGPTRSAVAFDRRVDDKILTFRADDIAPETAPFVDEQTGSRWTLAGRAVDGPLRGRELTWLPSLQCRWFAWSSEYPATTLLSLKSSGNP